MSRANRRRYLAVCVVAVVAMWTSPSAWAQTASAPAGAARADRFEISGGAGWFGGAVVGERDANLRTNASVPQAYRLFSTSTRVAGAPVFEARAAFTLTGRYAVEGHVAIASPELRTSVSADIEGAPSVVAVEPLNHYLLDGGLVVRLPEIGVGGLTPFAAGGAGYLRQLHEGRAFVEEGSASCVGGGVRRDLFARRQGALGSAGWRVDARLYLLSGGIAGDGEVQARAVLTGGLFVTF